jgi:hypothetical protein
MNTVRLQMLYRMAGRERTAWYYMHINCTCGLGKSLVDTFTTKEAARAAVPASHNGPVHTCAKSQPMIAEPVKKERKTRGKARKTRFVEGITAALRPTLWTGYVTDDISTGHRMEYRYAGGVFTDLIVRDEKGNSFEIRHPFTDKNAEKIVTALWDLMKTMEK